MNRTMIAATLCLLVTSSVHSGELDSFVAPIEGTTAAWSRVYDATHMAQHPDQQVEAMDLAVTFEIFDPTYDGQVNFELKVKLRNGTKGVTTGTCMGQGDSMWCGVECDGGGMVISHRSNGSVLADLEKVGFIRMSEVGCGEEDTGVSFSLESGKDDKQFLLHKKS